MQARKVYLIGAGPGKPDLITVRGLNILKQADVVVYDYLVDKSILENTKEGAELICCDKLAKKGRYSDGFLIHQEKINNLMIKKVKEGKRVVRLKNGDPSIFSRLSQELERLAKEGIDFEIVPGVTAASAASAFSGIPLTDRKFASSCVFVTGHDDPKKKKSLLDWQVLAKSSTLVLYMAAENLEKIVKQLLQLGRRRDTAVAIIENASLPTQRMLTGDLEDIVTKAKRYKIKPPAIIIIGEAAGLEKRFNWLKKSRRILFTGLSKERYFEKGIYFHLPLISIKPLQDYRWFDNYLKEIKGFDWVVFSSRYGVEYFFKRLKAIGKDSRVLAGIKIAVIGNSTAHRLDDFGIRPDLIPKNESSRGLLAEFSAKGGSASGGKKIDIKNKRVFLPRSNISDKGLTEGLKRLGAGVVASVAYKNEIPGNLPDMDLQFFDEIIFTSPSTIRNFRRRYRKVPGGIKISCIGDVTLREAKRCRLLD